MGKAPPKPAWFLDRTMIRGHPLGLGAAVGLGGCVGSGSRLPLSLRASLSVSLARSHAQARPLTLCFVSSDSLIVRRPRFSGQWRLPGKERRQTRFILACLPILSSIGWPISRAARPHDTSLFPAWRNPKAPSQQNSRLPNALSRSGIKNKHNLRSSY